VKNGEFKIDKGVPVPNITGWRALALAMDFGDSVFVKTDKETASVSHAIRSIGAKPVQRKERNGYRVWKIKIA
jgi:hypothetical protein